MHLQLWRKIKSTAMFVQQWKLHLQVIYVLQKKSFLFATYSNFQLIANFCNSIKIHCSQCIVCLSFHSCVTFIAFFKKMKRVQKKFNFHFYSHTRWSNGFSFKLKLLKSVFIHSVLLSMNVLQYSDEWWWMWENILRK